MALRLLDLPAGAEVIVPTFGFPATVNAVLMAGLRPVLVDVEPGTFNVAPGRVDEACNGATGAILVVHQFGLAAPMSELAAIADRRGLPIIEDAACAIGARRDGRPLGQHGVATAVSFHARKIVTTGEGGMLLTAAADLAERARRLRSQGADTNAVAQREATAIRSPGFPEPGFQLRMSDLSAAVGRVQLQRLPTMLHRRRQLADHYRRGLEGLPVTPPAVPAGVEPTWQSFCCVLDDASPIDRDGLLASLRSGGIGATFGAVVAHRQPAFVAFARGPLPVADRLADRAFLLPLSPQMSDADVDTVLGALRTALGFPRS
jgi:dTDP-4-amino-4,6-dideoxygalactose transaminase